MKKCFVNIKGTQGIDDQKDVIEFSSEALFGRLGDEIIICYNEGEMLGQEATQTKIIITGQTRVVTERSGGIESCLIVEKGVKSNCLYGTVQGELMLSITGEEIKNSINDDGGTLMMSYTISSGSQLISRNEVEITVRKV